MEGGRRLTFLERTPKSSKESLKSFGKAAATAIAEKEKNKYHGQPTSLGWVIGNKKK